MSKIFWNIIFERKEYTKKMDWYLNFPVIKVITGLRRVWKSYFLQGILQKIVKNNTLPENHIFYLNKEHSTYNHILDYSDLETEFSSFLEKNKLSLGEDTIIIAIDEVQEIQWWEKFINNYFSEYKESVDIFLTGSNSKMISSELSTLLAGRYVEVKMYTFSFLEYTEFLQVKRNKKTFLQYLKVWWLPAVIKIQNEETLFWYLKSIYESIFLQDIIKLYNIKNIDFFEKLYDYMLWNMGKIFSATSISKYLKHQRISLKVDTILNYLKYGESSFLLYKVQTKDVKTKKFFEIYNKYYLWDTGLRNSIVWYQLSKDIAELLENYVFLELKRKWYKVNVWKFSHKWTLKEIDFVAEKRGIIKYFQVTYLLASDDVIEREFWNLELIADSWEKYVVSLDDIDFWIRNWIKHINILDVEKYL